MSMKKRIRSRGRSSIPYLGNEDGMILVLTMVILLALSSLAATNIINAYLERSLAKNQHYASLALNAADAGIAHGLSWLVQNPSQVGVGTWPLEDLNNDGDIGKDGGFDVDGDGLDDANFNVTIEYALDEYDKDGDGSSADILYFNNPSCVDDFDNPGGPGTTKGGCFGFPDSIFDDDADLVAVPTDTPYPVILIRSVGTYGDVSKGAGRRVVELQVARNGLDVQVFGAVTANSNISTGGSIDLDGRAHDSDGSLCSGGGSCTCDDGYPAVTVPFKCDANDDGDCLDAGEDPTVNLYEVNLHQPAQTWGEDLGGTELQGDGATDPLGTLDDYGAPESNSPDEVLGMSAGDLAGMMGEPAVNGTVEKMNIFWYNYEADFKLQNDHQDRTYDDGSSMFPCTDVDETDCGYGVVIIHNPAFDPHVWDVSVDSGEPGSGYDITHGDYDENLDANDPDGDGFDTDYYDDRAPRNLDLNSNAEFKGLVIADSVSFVNGNADLIGALVSLSKIEFGTLGNGTADILYSCDAINTFTDQSYTTKLGWHRRF
jgi:hypothetical protein